MPLWLKVLTGSAIVAVLLYGAVLLGWVFSTDVPPDGIMCAQDAMQCPDGSYVGRTGPKCEFICPSDKPTTPQSKIVEVSIGKSAAALDVAVLPLEVLEDSRCPKGVECVWAGTVRLKARLTSGLGASTTEFTLGTPVTTEAEKVTLIEVRPAPTAGVTITPATYVFVFKIEKRL